MASVAPGHFIQRLSIWKTLGAEPFLVVGAVLPLTPNFSHGLVYTAFFYKMPFFIFLVGACVCLGLMAAVFLLFVWRAIRRVPVLTITETTITVLLARGTRSVSKSDVLRIIRIWPGANINLEIRGGSPMSLPLFFYEQPALVMDQLKAIVPQGSGAVVLQTS